MVIRFTPGELMEIVENHVRKMVMPEGEYEVEAAYVLAWDTSGEPLEMDNHVYEVEIRPIVDKPT